MVLSCAGPSQARQPIQGLNSSMVGTGYTPEGLALTYPTVDILSEMSWMKGPITNLDTWFEDYSQRRYGRQNPLASQAWKTIYADVFNSNRSDTSNVLTHLPDLNMTDDITYDPQVIVEGFDLMVFAVQYDPDIANQETFRYQFKTCLSGKGRSKKEKEEKAKENMCV